jgi:hypothetical protein
MEKSIPRPPRWDPLVLVVAVLSLCIGWLVRGHVAASVLPFSDSGSGISFSYPASWMSLPAGNTITTIMNPQSAGAYRSRITLTREETSPPSAMLSAEKAFLVTRSQQFTLYRLLDERDIDTGRVRIHEFTYAYAEDPFRDDPSRTSMPVIVKARDLLFTHKGSTYVITYSAEASSFDEALPSLRRLIESLSLH